ncbi:hypothetical protein [Methylocapsa palsarum]|uniref:Uncharacterized protein n=1 Tax=Methylocapsa palsarum TaxID=1612308 RepID=A0A1I4CDC3_9HYPH|nr:hypothetical protein [Methylocapsa palsarum]SFK79182.1 hypothetical protein SAMN05444581_12122 [Methylocapsa palsarum]
MSVLTAESKITKLIPRLASDFDGEVVATARAIGRALKSAGLDWHDVANISESCLNKPASVRTSSSRKYYGRAAEVAPVWNKLTVTQRGAWLSAIHRQHWLSVWEADFVADICARDPADIERLSQKQIICLNRIIGRAFSMGMRR